VAPEAPAGTGSPLPGDPQLPISLLGHAPHHPGLLAGLLELPLHPFAGLARGTQLGLQGFGSLALGFVTTALHQQVVTLQLGEANPVTAILKVRRQFPAPNAGADRVAREAGEFRRLSHINRWGVRDCHAPP
jgi:hypothetical protein